MKHRTLIGGKAFSIRKGRTFVDGKGYDIKKGRTLINGTGYTIPFVCDVVIEGIAYYRSAFVEIEGTAYQNDHLTGTGHSSVRYDLELEPGTVITVQDSYGVYFNGNLVAAGGGGEDSYYSFELTDDTTIVWKSDVYSENGTYITTD